MRKAMTWVMVLFADPYQHRHNYLKFNNYDPNKSCEDFLKGNGEILLAMPILAYG